MQIERPLVVCAFGWGREFRLYRETLYVGSRAYRLGELRAVQLKTQRTLGVPSACLELRFGREKVVLRGIAAVEDARRAAEYLVSWCGEGGEERHSTPDVSMPLKQPQTQQTQQTSQAPQTLPVRNFHEHATRPVDTPPVYPLENIPHAGLKRDWRHELKTEHLAQVEVLPVVNVPVRLGDGECAYYSSKATRCGELIRETLRSTFPAQDHGLLILTGRRLLFIGRKSQLILDYVHLLHISRLEDALAFEADHWQKRAIFKMPQPDLCAARLEAILQAQTTAHLPGTGPISPRAIGQRDIAQAQQVVSERVGIHDF
jgi:hypothetical protein